MSIEAANQTVSTEQELAQTTAAPEAAAVDAALDHEGSDEHAPHDGDDGEDENATDDVEASQPFPDEAEEEVAAGADEFLSADAAGLEHEVNDEAERAAKQLFRQATLAALAVRDSGHFFRSLSRSARRIGAESRSPYGVALYRTLGPRLRDFARGHTPEPAAFRELCRAYVEGDNLPLPVLVALATRALGRALTPSVVTRPGVVAGLARGVEQAARTLVRKRGRAALASLPSLVCRAGQSALAQGLPARALPEAVAQASGRTASSAEPASGSRRRFRIPGPVEIVIYER